MLALVPTCQGQLLFRELKAAFGHRSATTVRERRSCELISKKSMPKSRAYGPSLPPLITTSMNADGGILNILGRGHKYGRSPLSGIVCSVASMNLRPLASAPAADY
jgi:hypothetical protein